MMSDFRVWFRPKYVRSFRGQIHRRSLIWTLEKWSSHTGMRNCTGQYDFDEYLLPIFYLVDRH